LSYGPSFCARHSTLLVENEQDVCAQWQCHVAWLRCYTNGTMLRVLLSVAAFVLTGAALFFLYDYYDGQRVLLQSDHAYAVERLDTLIMIIVIVAFALVVSILIIVQLLIHTKKIAGMLAYSRTRDIAYSRELFRKFYELSPVPYLRIHANGVIKRPNKASLRMFGEDELTLIGKQLFELLVVPDEPDQLRFYRDQLQRGVPLEQKEVQVTLGNGERRWVLLSAEVLSEAHGPEGSDLLVTLVDIHEQKELERIKTEFLSLASHQLRAPLANLKWYIDFLLTRRSESLTQEISDYLQKMYRRNEEMIDLVNTLLNLSRVEMGRIKIEKKEADISELLRSVVEELEPAAHEKQIELDVQTPDTLMFDTDARLVRIVVQNLLTNAFRYTPKEGSVRVALVARGSEVIVSVADTGVGIPAAEQGRIFMKMYRATNARAIEANGNGIGLYMCKALVEAMGGTINFTSTVGKGTVFTVTLS